MKTIIFLSLALFAHSSLAETKTYDSYNEIVDKLSAQRNQNARSQMSVTVPAEERMQVSLGLTNSSTNVAHAGMGNVSQNGFLFGVAVPLLGNELYTEGFAKFFNAAHEGSSTSSLRQFEARLAHKEPLSFALWNIGVGLSARFMDVETAQGSKSINTPNILLTSGLERRLTERMSAACDLGYHRSLTENESGKNSFEFIVRMNYHL